MRVGIVKQKMLNLSKWDIRTVYQFDADYIQFSVCIGILDFEAFRQWLFR